MTPSDTTGATALADHSRSIAAIVDTVGAATLAVLGRHHALGSAVVWRPGIVVAAAHVFRRTPAAVTLVGSEGRSVAATLVGIDSSTDLAVFRLADETSVAAIAPGDASGVRAGHFALAVGRSGEGDLLASAGLVNRAGGPWQTWLGGHVDRLIRLDGGVYDGLSGAPVADASGAVVGIATAALSRSYGIVVPASTVSRVVDALLAHGRIARPRLGIGAQPVPITSGSGHGLLVTSLSSGGPAERAGVLIGDILTHAAGVPVSDLGDLRRALGGEVGKTVTLMLLRGGVATELACAVGEWPAERACR